MAVTDNRFGFGKRFRLTKTDEYSSVFGFRRAIKSLHFLLHYRPRAAEEDSTARLGIVVPKRLVKAAVRRNLIKRIGREQFRLLRSGLPARDLVLRLNAKWHPLDRKALAAEIGELLLKLQKSGQSGERR
jgi:ribonuclease P protein component